MTDLFIYEEPFIVPNIGANNPLRYDYILDQLDDFEKQNERKIHEHIFKFAADEGLVIRRADDELRIDPGDDLGSWRWFITTANFRSLVAKNQYDKFTYSLMMGENHPVDKVIDLHFRLGTLFDHKLLNTIVNRLYSAISLIPYAVMEREEKIEWKSIHKQTPFIWICILVQVMLRTDISKTVAE